MKRREAIKSITLSTGLVISAGSWASLLQSCTPKVELTWQPLFLSKDGAKTINALAELIIPKAEGIGALDVRVPQIIDLFLNGVTEEETAVKFQKGLSIFEEVNKREHGKYFFQMSKSVQDEILASYFKLSPEETQRVMLLIYQEEPDAPEEYFIYSFLTLVRDFTIHAYRTSETIGEEVLSYDPVPGVYQGCIPLADVGNSWSL